MPEKSTSVYFRPTVVIGVGGTGYNVILKLKKRLLDAYGKIPSVIQFLSIDTTENLQDREKTALGNTVNLDANEICQLSVSNPGAFVRGNPHVQEWWYSNLNANAPIKSGAGQIRARGRLALFANAGIVYNRIHSAINQVRDLRNNKSSFQEGFFVAENSNVEVYIVGSLAGGTGSGMFLDTAFIAGHQESTITITGVLALPRVYEGLPFTQNVKSNGYAALKEIENFWNIKESFEINYGGQQVEVSRSPFDLLFLIDSFNELAKTLRSPDDLQTVIADGLYILIGSQIGIDSGNAIDNIKTMILGDNSIKGKRVSYASFGCSYLTLPTLQYRQLETESAKTLIQDNFLGKASLSSLKSDINDFLVNHGLLDQKILSSLSETNQGGQIQNTITSAGLRFDRTVGNELRNKHTNFINGLDSKVPFQLSLKLDSLKENYRRAIQEKWETLLSQPQGLDYAGQFLTELRDHIKKLQQDFQKKQNEQDQQMRNLPFSDRLNQVNNASQKLMPNKNNIQEKCQSYISLVNQQAQLYLSIKRYEKAIELLGELQLQIDTFLRDQTILKKNLERIVSDLEQDLNTIITQLNHQGENLFEHRIQYFDAKANKPIIRYDDFLRYLREGHTSMSQLTTLNLDSLKKNIIGFIHNAYLPLTGLSIENIISKANPEIFARDLNQLWSLATPRWRYEENKIPVANQGSINDSCYYGVENAISTILKTGEISKQLRTGNSDASFVSTAEKDRITLFRVKVGVPLFALHGINDMEKDYQDPNRQFKHLHKDWDQFPDLMPADELEQILETFSLAQAFKLIQKKPEGYIIERQLKREIQSITLGKGRKEAFEEFRKKTNQNLVAELQRYIDRKIKESSYDKLKEFLLTYIKDLEERLERFKNSLSSDDYKQVEVEISCLESFIKKSDPNSI